MSKNIKTVPTQEYEEVVATVAKYVEGLRVGSVNGVAEAFHKKAVMYGFTDGELLGGPIQNLYDFVEKNGTAPTPRKRTDVSRSATTAVVRGGHGEGCDRRDTTDFNTSSSSRHLESSPRSITV